MDVSVLPAFLLAVLLISASPGPAMALILRRAALHGTRAAVPTVLGLEAGIYLWALAAGAGLAALVAASAAAYTVLRVVGAVVLVGLGIRAWLAAWRDRGEPEPAVPASGPGSRRAFGEGLVVQLANPKAAVFVFAFYPQFVPDDGAVLLWTAGARAAAGLRRDGPLRGPRRSGRARVRVAAHAAHPPAPGGGERHGPRGAGAPRGGRLALTDGCGPPSTGGRAAATVTRGGAATRRHSDVNLAATRAVATKGTSLMGFDIAFPQVNDGAEQDVECCDVTVDGDKRRIRFHDYGEIFKVPGLYEHLFHDVLDCRSPQVVCDLLGEQLEPAATIRRTSRSWTSARATAWSARAWPTWAAGRSSARTSCPRPPRRPSATVPAPTPSTWWPI
jgi:threonine/homoserine/homoserine lactone efflux protein